MITLLNQTAEKWFSWQLSMFWQAGLLIIIVAGIDLLIKRWTWPQVRYALWLLILVKLILPPTLTSPVSFTAEIPSIAKQTLAYTDFKNNRNTQITTINKYAHVVLSPTENIKPVETIYEKPVNSIIPAPFKTALSSKAYVFFVWIAGVGILSAWLIIRLNNLRKQYVVNNQKMPERLENLLISTAGKLKIRNIPQIVLTDKIKSPAVFGIFKSVVLMPAGKLQNMTSQDVENIFLHELAHIKRGDLFVHAFYIIIQIVYWFNPLLWLIRNHLQNLRELCCDATVARILGEKTASYRQTLLETARQLLAQPVEPGLGFLGLFENSSWLADRLGRLEKKSWRYGPLRIATVFVLICLMSAFVLPMTKYIPPADFVIKGTVTDAQTGKPIEGAKVGDTEEYADGKFCTSTDANGNYSYKTWYEEHGIIATADGYRKDKKTLLTKIFGKEKEKIINFALEPNDFNKQAGNVTNEKEKLRNLVEDFFKDNYRDIKNRKTIEWGQPIIDENGNQTIRYKYEANIWDSKDTYVYNELFTFDKDGKFVSSKKLSVVLKDSQADNNLSAGHNQESNSAAIHKNIDVYIADLQIKPYEAGNLWTLTVKIGNRGTATAPAFRLNFYRGDPNDNLNLHGKPQSGSYGAGPIKPGEFWNEQSSPFALNEGQNVLFVVLDINNDVAEANENNNQAMLGINVKDGKIIKKIFRQSVKIIRYPDGHINMTAKGVKTETRPCEQ